MDDPLLTPVQFVRGVGPQRAELFAKLGIHTVTDLLWHLPRDVLDLTQLSAVFELNSDRVHSIRGEVVDRDARLTSTGKTMTALLFKSDGGFVRAVWFNQPYMLRKYELGQHVLLTGQPKLRERRWEFSHPETQPLDVDDDDHTAAPGVLPRYGLTEGLRMRDVRRATAGAVDEYADQLAEFLPDDFRLELGLPRLSDAVRQLHVPSTMDEYRAGRRRVLLDDLLEFEIAVVLRRRAWNRENKAIPLPCSSKIDARIRRLFAFQFTNGQDQAVTEIVADIAQERAMHRLLQADVGAGKTAIAMYAMLVAVANGTQAVLMAPTEVLAQQHWSTIEQILEHSRVERRLLTGQLTPAARNRVREEIANGTAQLIIGTQSLIQESVAFHRLGLAVIDEQHKFGVGQRGRFHSGETAPHRLVMTATPIPRSLCLTQFGDLDLTSIRELPPGRQRVVTSRVT
ncbi:MAG: DEAD/DEAH box helicase, partial [Planctomycetaceae bacterium]|nr:DEAD/DEAH box helicase [Planctomycetaceae bacterium]